MSRAQTTITAQGEIGPITSSSLDGLPKVSGQVSGPRTLARVKRLGPLQPFDLNGSVTRTRTWDPVINSHLLYRLSYHGTVGARF